MFGWLKSKEQKEAERLESMLPREIDLLAEAIENAPPWVKEQVAEYTRRYYYRKEEV